MQEFTNEVIEIELLPRYETVKLNSPHPDYWKVIMINIFTFFGIIGIALAAMVMLDYTAVILLDKEFKANLIYIVIGFVLLFIITFMLYKASFKKKGFALREKDIIFKSGIVAETTSIIPLNRIQHVSLNEGLFSRMFKLATLQIYTAGGASGHIHIAGVPIDEAKTIKEALLKRIDLLDN